MDQKGRLSGPEFGFPDFFYFILTRSTALWKQMKLHPNFSFFFEA
jgi:hypothetical protein